MVVWRYNGQTGITVRGPETRAISAYSPADAEFFGIQFKLGTFMPHLPLSNLVNGDLMLPEATSKSFWLRGAAWQFPTFENADTYVDRMARAGMLVREPVVNAVLESQQPALSLRSVQYRFLHVTGLTYSTVRQIERARQAAALLQQGVPILDTVYEAGYFDQAHLTRSLKRFMGQTPLQFARLKQPE